MPRSSLPSTATGSNPTSRRSRQSRPHRGRHLVRPTTFDSRVTLYSVLRYIVKIMVSTPIAPHTIFRRDIQGLRAVAVLGVLLVHAGVPGLAGGFAGVDVFFVISGFLITAQILARVRAGSLRLTDFYAGRVRRLLPAALVIVAATAAVSPFVLPPMMLPQSLADAAAALYLPNLVFAQRGADYFADSTPSLYQHFWSLGVEEQFYLLWPLGLLAVLWCIRRTRRELRPKFLVAVFGGIAAASLAACVYVTWADQSWAFYPMWTRAWQFACGALVAVCASALLRIPEGWRAALSWAGMAGIAVAFVGFSSELPYPGTAALLPTLATAAMIAAGDAPRGAGIILHTRPMQWVGLVSYSLYLVHWPLLQLVQAGVGHDRPLPAIVAVALSAAAVPFAWLLYRFVETPLRRPPASHHTRRRLVRPLATGLAASALIAAVTISGSSATAAAPLTSDRNAYDKALTAPPGVTDYVPRSVHPTLAAAVDDLPSMYADGCQLGFLASKPHPCTFGGDGLPRVVLFGDSHAGQWQPALAEVARREGFQLVTQTKSSCRSMLERQPGDQARDRACTAWRTAVLADLTANPPAAVILADFYGAQIGDATTASALWSTGLRNTVAAIPEQTIIIVLADTPDLGTSPVPCLSRHLENTASCAPLATDVLTSVGRTTIEASIGSTRATYLDLTDHLCTESCPPIIGNTLVYRDANHLTATFSAQLAGPLDRALTPLLAPVLNAARAEDPDTSTD